MYYIQEFYFILFFFGGGGGGGVSFVILKVKVLHFFLYGKSY